MNTFEQRAADAIRNLTLSVAFLAAAVIAVCALATWGLLSAQSDSTKLVQEQAALKAAVQSPTHGKDIAVWCSAINADRTYNKAFVAKVTRGHVAYVLGNLNCAQIEQREAASTHAKH